MKRLIVCADGTWNSPKQEGADARSSTNVLKLLRAVKPIADDGTEQVVFYDKGVGTGGFCDRILGGAFGVGLAENVLDCYRFLANNYQPNDEIYLFGFSRGAFTVRSLGGLLGAIGLVSKLHLGKLHYGWRYYRTPPGDREAAEDLLAKLGPRIQPVPITCIGVWDTVGALGVPVALFKNLFGRRHRFHDTQLGREVETALHAVAIDERRAPFKPTLWHGEPATHQHVEQVWFPGVHSNVGGGYPDTGLSDAALEWMLRRVEALHGIEFDADYRRHHVDPSPYGRIYNSFRGVYRLLGKNVRTIPESHDLSTVAVERMKSSAYSPPNVPTE